MEVSDDDLARACSPPGACAQRIEEALEPDGFNILNSCAPAAWQTIFHFHLHVIPRYDDDPLKLPWIPRGATPTRSPRSPTGSGARRAASAERTPSASSVTAASRRSCSTTRL